MTLKLLNKINLIDDSKTLERFYKCSEHLEGSFSKKLLNNITVNLIL